MKDVDEVSGAIFGDASFLGETASNSDGIKLWDKFNRLLNDYGVNLLDWQGYLANPHVALTIGGPDNAAYPLNITVEALGTSRLMLDNPSTLSADGASKTLSLNQAADKVTFYLAIHPDRSGEYEVENHILKITSIDSSNAQQQLEVPIRVLDQDEATETPSIPIVVDTRYDNLSTKHFSKPGILEAATRAIHDWFYFFDVQPFDEVAPFAENLSLTGVDWKNHENVTNNEAFSGLWVFLRSFSGPYSTGYPSQIGEFHTRDGAQVKGPIFRSVANILHLKEGKTIFTSLDDELWYQTTLRENVVDIYGLTLHEFGHAIAFGRRWAGMQAYSDSGGENAERVIAYQGRPVPVNMSMHIAGEEIYWDRLSGQNGGWQHKFPTRRWMQTKLKLLIAENAGWPLKNDLTPFIDLNIKTDLLPTAYRNRNYRFALEPEGGIPFYDWQIVSGNLPNGFQLNRYTGVLKAKGIIGAESGKYVFTVRLNDYDDLTTPVEKVLELNIQ